MYHCKISIVTFGVRVYFISLLRCDFYNIYLTGTVSHFVINIHVVSNGKLVICLRNVRFLFLRETLCFSFVPSPIMK